LNDVSDDLLKLLSLRLADELHGTRGTERDCVQRLGNIRARAKDYVRHAQERLIAEPILRQLQANCSPRGTEKELLRLLETWRNRPHAAQGYGPGNVLNLLRVVRGNLRGLDLSRLALREAYLAGIETQDASLTGADLSEAVLGDSFKYPTSVIMHREGTRLVAGTGTGEVWLWRVEDRTPLLVLRGHSGQVYRLALSGNERIVASGGEDGTIRLWELSAGQPLASFEAHTSGVLGVALNEDGRLMASGGLDGSVRLWDTSAERPIATLRGHAGVIRDLAMSNDGRLVASGSQDGTLTTVALYTPTCARWA
jgi:hypothetical protein